MIDTCQVLNRRSSTGSSVPAREAFQSPRWNFNLHMWDRLSQETCQHLRWLFNTMGDLSCRSWCGRSMETPTGCCKWHGQNASGVYFGGVKLLTFCSQRLVFTRITITCYHISHGLRWNGLGWVLFPGTLITHHAFGKARTPSFFPQKFAPASHTGPWACTQGWTPESSFQMFQVNADYVEMMQVNIGMVYSM